MTLAALESFVTMFASPIKTSIDIPLRTTPLHLMIKEIEEDELRPLCTLLKEYSQETPKNIIEKRHRSFIMPASAYLPEILPSTLDCAKDGDAIIVKCCGLRYVQWLIAKGSFYVSDCSRFDTVLVRKSAFRDTVKKHIKNVLRICRGNSA